VCTTITERAFSATKIIKTRPRNKIEDGFFANNLVLYIEREIAESFNLDSILDDFVLLKVCIECSFRIFFFFLGIFAFLM
jgi:hypothetical protein